MRLFEELGRRNTKLFKLVKIDFFLQAGLFLYIFDTIDMILIQVQLSLGMGSSLKNPEIQIDPGGYVSGIKTFPVFQNKLTRTSSPGRQLNIINFSVQVIKP